MKAIKKLLIVVLALCVSVCMGIFAAACGDDNSGNNNPGGNTETNNPGNTDNNGNNPGSNDNNGNNDNNGDNNGDNDDEELVEDTLVLPDGGDGDVAYSFQPGWLTNAGLAQKQQPYAETIVMEDVWAYNTWEMQGEAIGWNSNTVTFEFKDNGVVEVTIAGGGQPNTYTGTYEVWSMMNNNNFVIQLDNIAADDSNPNAPASAATTWSTGGDRYNRGGQIGMNIFCWISKGGRIVLSHNMGGEGYIFNVAMGGGDMAGDGGHEGGGPLG